MKRHAPCPVPPPLFPRACIDTHRGGEKTAGGPSPFEYGAPQAARRERKKKRKQEEKKNKNGTMPRF